jgi:hypothetical protein
MPHSNSPLSDAQIASFIADGFVRIDNAFSTELAEECRAILWRDTGVNPDDPSTWTRPVIRLGHYGQPPFRAAANTPQLHLAYDQLVGKGRWLPPQALGTFPVRFPSPNDPGDAGWHVDVSFGTDASDFMEWRANVTSKGRMLLMLFVFSEIDEDDAPTRIRVGSHLDVARLLAPAGDAGLSLRQMDAANYGQTVERPIVHATGAPGTVYLCHPFLVHAAQPHRGTHVKFMAQPPLLPAAPLQLDRGDEDYSPVEMAIRTALAG